MQREEPPAMVTELERIAAKVVATKALSLIPGVASYRDAVNRLLKSVVRKIRTLRSVGAGGGWPEAVTRCWG
jgi:hypothetical protein